MAKSDPVLNKNPHKGHRDRMRERFFENGFDNYRPHEVLEQILFYALPRVNTNEIAHELLYDKRDILDVLLSDREQLKRTHGIGDKSADYLKSILPRVEELIFRQYRELPELNVYNIAFLGDWFFRIIQETGIGIILCDADRRFIDFRIQKYILDDGELDPYSIGEIISKQYCAQRYYVVTAEREQYVTRENILVLRDYTSRLGSFMTDAYQMYGMRPVSYLY